LRLMPPSSGMFKLLLSLLVAVWMAPGGDAWGGRAAPGGSIRSMRMSALKKGDRVVVVGATGGVGQLITAR
jgi:NADPH:quinone reductase-like Zn-dependent oxidoreductase